jgi:hypothetical protein
MQKRVGVTPAAGVQRMHFNQLQAARAHHALFGGATVAWRPVARAQQVPIPVVVYG